MRNSKSLFLLLFALVVITISFVLISIWGYHFYFGEKNVKPAEPIAEKSIQPILEKPVAINSSNTRDSLQTLYNTTVQDFEFKQDSGLDNTDTLAVNLNNKLAQYNELRNEIANILKNKTSAADMIVAREKIAELQQKVDQLRNKTNEVAEENKRLNDLVKKLINERPKLNGNTQTVIAKNKSSAEKNITPFFSVFNLHLAAATIVNDKFHLTSLASRTDKLIGSLAVRNNSEQLNTFEIEVVIVQPNGKVLQNSAWESGIFETPSGKKVYSVKFNFDCPKGENKTLNFSLGSTKFQKGNYTMLVYHSGLMIARLVKYLA